MGIGGAGSQPKNEWTAGYPSESRPHAGPDRMEFPTRRRQPPLSASSGSGFLTINVLHTASFRGVYDRKPVRIQLSAQLVDVKRIIF